MTNSLLADHEKNYLEGKPPSNFVVNDNVIKVGGFGYETTVKEKFTWGSYEAAKDHARNLNPLVKPLVDTLGQGQAQARVDVAPLAATVRRTVFVSSLSCSLILQGACKAVGHLNLHAPFLV